MMKLQFLCLLALCAAAAATDVAEVSRMRAVEVFAHPAVPSNDDDVETAKRALEVIRDFIEIFNSDIFEKAGIKQVAEIVSKIFSFVISIINLIQGLGPQESAEMKFLREQFKEVHAKLDSISLQLDDVKRLIEWQTTRAIYAQHENFIAATSHLLDSFVSAPEHQREVLKRQFLTAFQHNPLATLKLYQAVVETDFVVSSNLAAAVVHYTQNHRRHTMNFLLAMQRLIMRGAQLEIAYEKMLHGDSAAAVTKSIWDGRMEKLLTRMKQVETDVKNRYLTQMETDVDRLALDQRGLSNQDFSGQMYNLVAGKFDWLYWFSLAYADVSGWDRHSLSHCTGVVRLRTHGSRNVAVISSDPKTSQFTVARGNAALDAAQSDGSGAHADAWTNLIRSKTGNYCHDATFVGSICWGCNVWFTVRSDRYAYRKMSRNGEINTIIFG